MDGSFLMKKKKALSMVFEEQQFSMMEINVHASRFEPTVMNSYSLEERTLVQHLETRGGIVYSRNTAVVGVLNHRYYQLFQLKRPPANVADLQNWVAVQLGEKVAFPMHEVIFEIFESALPAYVFVIALHQPLVSSLVSQVKDSPCNLIKLVPTELALTEALAYAYPDQQKIAYIYVEDEMLRIILVVNKLLVSACVLLNHIDVSSLDDTLVVNTILLNVESVLNKLKQNDAMLAGDDFVFCYSCDKKYNVLFEKLSCELSSLSVFEFNQAMAMRIDEGSDGGIRYLMALGGAINAVH
jgi:hypothetical protein